MVSRTLRTGKCVLIGHQLITKLAYLSVEENLKVPLEREGPWTLARVFELFPRRALEEAKALNWGCIVSARSGETEDTTITHLATGWDAGQLKVGSFARSERMAKWNEGVRIEDEQPLSVTY